MKANRYHKTIKQAGASTLLAGILLFFLQETLCAQEGLYPVEGTGFIDQPTPKPPRPVSETETFTLPPLKPPFALQLPIKCRLGHNCTIQNYYDHDPTSEATDYSCGVLTYDGHTGTDFRIPNLADMQEGVEVVAAATGTVKAVRDGMPDINMNDIGAGQLVGREAGNAVSIAHVGGWETQYLHMKRGSIKVAPGQEIKRGDVIGEVGLSGMAQFPHVHFEVKHKGKHIDPFNGFGEAAGAERLKPECEDVSNHYWDNLPIYRSTGYLNAGFSTEKPTIRLAEQGGSERAILPANAPALVFWIELYGVQHGDRGQFFLFDPARQIIHKRKIKFNDGNKARWFGFSGKGRGEENLWHAGKYTGRFILLRRIEGRSTTIVDTQRTLEINPASSLAFEE